MFIHLISTYSPCCSSLWNPSGRHLQVDMIFWLEGRYLRYKILLISVTSETQCELIVISRLQCNIQAWRKKPVYWSRKHVCCSHLILELSDILGLCGDVDVLKLLKAIRIFTWGSLDYIVNLKLFLMHIYCVSYCIT